MYDKYSTANGLTFGPALPKHKAILFSGATSGTSAISINAFNGRGATIGISLTLSTSPYIFPMQVHSIPSALPGGVTGFYLS